MRPPKLVKINKLPEWLQKAVTNFAKTHPTLSTKDGALEKCIETSDNFVAKYQGLCAANGYDCSTENLSSKRYIMHYYGRYVEWGHFAVRVDNWIIDFTIRQFDHRLAFPRVWKHKKR